MSAQAVPDSHVVVEPRILYFGTPVVLVTTLNEDGTPNLMPMSSAWALGHRLALGFGEGSKTLLNLRRERECVLNLPSPEHWTMVERLAPLTGMNPVPPAKRHLFRHEKDKFGVSGFTPVPSQVVAPPRVAECRLQIEARVDRWYPLGDAAWIVVVEAVRVHAHPEIVAGPHHIDPRAWRPLIYNFRHYFELGRELGRTFRADTPGRRAGAEGGAGREPGGAAPGPGPTALRARPPGCPAS